MSNDVSVSSIDVLKGYNNRIKIFNTSVNTLLFGFRRKIESIVSEKKAELHRLERAYNVISDRINEKIKNVEELVTKYNWEGNSLAIINNELIRLHGFRREIDNIMMDFKRDHNLLTIQLDQVIQSANTFAISNQNLLDSNISRMGTLIGHLENYKTQQVK